MATEEKAVSQNGLLYYHQGIKQKLAEKVDKEAGKGLSTNDYTTAEKNKLAGIDTGANKTTVNNTLTSTSTTEALSAAQGKALSDRIDGVVGNMENLGYGDMMKATYDADGDGVVDNAAQLGGQAPSYYAKATDIPAKTSQLTNDSGYITQHQDISGKLDKTGDASNVSVTFTAASTRTNVTTGDKLNTILGKIAKFFTDLKSVAFTGSYNDLTNKPTIPTVTNDLSDALKTNYDAAYAHSQEAHAPADAQANVIESVKVNGTAQTITSKAVNISVPTTVAQLSDSGNYALKSDITNVYKYKGSVDTFAELPTEATVGDVYNVVGEKGANFGWTGTEWDALGEIFSLSFCTNAEIDAILAS